MCGPHGPFNKSSLGLASTAQACSCVSLRLIARICTTEPDPCSAPPDGCRPARKCRPTRSAWRVNEKGNCMTSCSNSSLDASVLVLNKLFMAIHIISVRRAFCLLAKDIAEVVSLEDGGFTTYD